MKRKSTLRKSQIATTDDETVLKRSKTKLNLIEDKEINYGSITWSDIRKFLSHSAGMTGFVVYMTISVLVAFLQLACSYVLAIWAKQDLEEQQKAFYPWLLVGSTAVFFVLSFIRALMGVLIINTSAKNMFKAMTNAVLRSKVLFFDSNPLGRIVTRFTKDISVIDMLMTYYIVMISFGFLKLITTVIVIAFISPIVLIPAFIAGLGMVCLVKVVGPVLVETQRMDSVIRGPIHNTFGMVV